MPATVQEVVLPEIEALKQRIAGGVKWTPPHQIHLTMKFLGEFNPKHLNGLLEEVESFCANIAPIHLTSSGFGVFPPRGNPRIIWFGVEHSADLAILYKNTESACEQFGYPPEERPFSPHFTIGRVKRHAERSELDGISQAMRSTQPPKQIIFAIDTLTFFESTLTPSGPIYKEQFAITLP